MATDQRFLNPGIASGSGEKVYGIAQVAVAAASSLVRIALPARVPSRLGDLIDQLDAFQRRPNNIHGYTFKPAPLADRYARFYIYELYSRMGDDFPTPAFVLDGEGGIIIKWTANGHNVRLNCFPDPADNYIYFENGDYDVEDNVTLVTIIDRLDWLIRHEREPAR